MIQLAPASPSWPPVHIIVYKWLLLMIQPAPAGPSWPPSQLIVYNRLLLMGYSRFPPIIAGLLAISLSTAGS